ncbi:MAG: bile acid:sodium symporter family protein [Nitrososphaeraceae archaeon]
MTKINNNNNKRKNSLLLLAVVLASMMCGLFFSDQSKILEPYLLIWLGMLLFLNLIRLDIMDLVSDFVRPKRIIILSILKLVIIPLTMYQIIHVIYSKESLSVLLLSGISTGLGAPFIVNFVGGKLQTVVAMIMVTSLAVPLVLPVLVYSLFKTQFSIPFLNMVILLSTALFIPLASGWATKRYAPKIAKVIEERSLPASLIVIVLINLGMFAKFSNYFFEDPLFVLAITGLAFALFGIYGLFGYTVDAIFLSNNVGTKNEKKNERLSAFISMSYVNNILVAVFAQQFFGSQVAALAAFYNIPYYIGILILARSVSNDLCQAVK